MERNKCAMFESTYWVLNRRERVRPKSTERDISNKLKHILHIFHLQREVGDLPGPGTESNGPNRAGFILPPDDGSTVSFQNIVSL
jgi:hypothetical protein